MKDNRKSLLVLLLLFSFTTVGAQVVPIIRSIRTTAYEAIQKDTAWVTGKVIDNIHFVKNDRKGRMSVENILMPDGSPKGKIIYKYDAAERIVKEIYATAKAGGVMYSWDYGYDEQGRMNSITTLNGNQDTLGIVTAFFNADGKVIKKQVDDRRKGEVNLVEVADTALFRRESEWRIQRWKASKKRREVVTEKDEYENWTQIITYQLDGITPEYITCRNIVYEGMDSDWDRNLLYDKVKSVRQYSYVAVPKGPETVLRGEKKGNFFIYEFDKQGRKTSDAIFTEAGIPVGRRLYEYNENRDLLKETYQTVTGEFIERTEYKYDEEGTCKRGLIYDEKGELTGKIIYRYDLEGNLIQETIYSKSGAKEEDYRYYYDSYGQQIGRNILTSKKGDMYSYNRTWNFQKRMTGEEMLLPEGGKDVYTYRYNKKGEVIAGTEMINNQQEVKYIYKFHRDSKENWKIRIKYIDDVPVVYEEREYTYYE